MKHDYFDGFIGQESLKTKLTFLIEAHKKTKIFDPVLLVSKRGDGKSDIARRIGKNLLKSDNSGPKKFLEINSASIKTVSAFVDDIVIPHILGNQETTIFCDEFGEIDKKVANWLLSVLCPNKENKTHAWHNGVKYEFDYRCFSFIGATTDAHLISLPMKSRLRRLEFQPYTLKNLIKILENHSPDITYKNNVQLEIAKVLRASPRATVMMAKDIRQYTENKGRSIFNENDWEELKYILGILPLGLTIQEFQLLKFLEDGPATLTCLAAKFNLTPSEVRKEIELYPMSLNLMTIDGKRKITAKGREILKCVENQKVIAE